MIKTFAAAARGQEHDFGKSEATIAHMLIIMRQGMFIDVCLYR